MTDTSTTVPEPPKEPSTQWPPKAASTPEPPKTGDASEPPKAGDTTPLSDPKIVHGGASLIQQEDGSTAISQPAAPLAHTVLDQHGVARHVQSAVADSWTPAPTDPDEFDVKRADERNKAEEERFDAIKEGRIDPVSGKMQTKDEAAAAKKVDA